MLGDGASAEAADGVGTSILRPKPAPQSATLQPKVPLRQMDELLAVQSAVAAGKGGTVEHDCTEALSH